MPIAAATTDGGARRARRPSGSVTVAATDPSEITRVSQTASEEHGGRDIVANGASTLNTPAATATPLPPWNRSHTG